MEPPAAASGDAEPDRERVTCPWCESDQVERMALYGPQQMADQYRCCECLNFFGRVLKR